ncbi:sel1 repeat family protein [Nocardia coubleae]|uniref:Sel1 repeat family protein n=1 Tax=Nocardia coubleae TaxID=356147 RepID=A0A846VYA9_9NOCA|nr:sel1 repeat family protein [Nocardia coubleae]NKX85789.1 sel1 repeat family protein [Nocardia coubleae]
MSVDRRQLAAAVCMLIAVVAVPIGLILVVGGFIASREDPNAGPTCDGKVMTPGTECWSYGDDSSGVTTYEQAVEEKRRGAESAKGILPTGITVLVVGAAAATVCYRYTRSATGTRVAPQPVEQPQDHRPSFTELEAHATSALGQGDLDRALYWYQVGADAGDPDAMGKLAALLRQDGNIAEAEFWHRRATKAGQAAAPETSRAAHAPADDMKVLLAMVMGNHAAAGRLIDFEQRRDPGADRAVSIRRAIERLRDDRHRQG